MGLSFDEVMRGTIETPEGARELVLTAHARSGSIFAFGGWLPLWLSGHVDLEGVTTGATVEPESSLEIGLPFHRFLRYQFRFRDEAGHAWRFIGRKRIRWTRFPWTITRLEGRVFRDGVEVGPATLRFHWSELPRFLKSWRPWSRAAAGPARIPVASAPAAVGLAPAPA